MLGAILVGVGIIAAVLPRLLRHEPEGVDGDPWRWWRWATGLLVAQGVLVWTVGHESTVGFTLIVITSLALMTCGVRWAYLMDRAGVGRRVVVIVSTAEWPLEVIDGEAQRPLELSELKLSRELHAQADAWTSVPPSQRDGAWRARGEMLLERLGVELGGGRWEVDRRHVRDR